MRTFCLFAALLLVFATSMQCSPVLENTSTMPKDSCSFLALGDSYTIAERLPTKDSWATQAAGLVRGRGIPLHNPLIIARTGWRTDQLINAIHQAQNATRIATNGYDLVTLLIGVNNQYQGGSEEVFRSEFISLLKMSVSLARNKPSRVVVLSIPDYSVAPFAQSLNRSAIAAAIDRFNTIKREECAKAGIAFVDITPLSRDFAQRPFPFVSDGLHPSPEQYAAWANLALLTIVNALKR
jgi:lysophospholipase L1-like esterase